LECRGVSMVVVVADDSLADLVGLYICVAKEQNLGHSPLLLVYI
jgi:hypothetical protein